MKVEYVNMYVITEKNGKRQSFYFKHKTIRYLMFIMIKKLKGYEIGIIEKEV